MACQLMPQSNDLEFVSTGQGIVRETGFVSPVCLYESVSSTRNGNSESPPAARRGRRSHPHRTRVAEPGEGSSTG